MGGWLGERHGVVEQGTGTFMPPPSISSYDSNLNASRDDKKNKFASTMEFVEDYLNNVVSEAVPFANEEKNTLTFEVGWGCLGLAGSGLWFAPPWALVYIQGWVVGPMTLFSWLPRLPGNLVDS